MHGTARITLDVGHADLADGLRPAHDTFAAYLRHVHVHNCADGRDHREIGTGALDFSAYLEDLRAYPFTLAIESRNDEDAEGCVLKEPRPPPGAAGQVRAVASNGSSRTARTSELTIRLFA